ncbi:zinc-ribbon domain-containing protein, partial [Raoultibacter massiliensis]
MCFRPPTVDAGPVKCPKCGAEVDPKADECPSCGAKATPAPGMP